MNIWRNTAFRVFMIKALKEVLQCQPGEIQMCIFAKLSKMQIEKW